MKRAAASLLAICLFAGVPSATLAAGVTLPQLIQQHLGVKTQRIEAAQRATEIDAFAKVMDPGPLAQLVSDLRTAQAGAAASKAEAFRARALNSSGGAVSTKDMEAAVAQARSDALKVVGLRHRLGLEWGPGIAGMTEARRDRLVDALASGSAALVHVDTHNNEGQSGARVVKIDVGPNSLLGTVIGPARAAEPRLQSSGLIVEVIGKSAILLSVGLTQSAHIQSASPQRGFIFPRDAAIRYRGSVWVYVRTGATRFERRMAINPTPQDKGLFVSDDFADGDEIVVKGAAAVFAVEQSGWVGAR